MTAIRGLPDMTRRKTMNKSFAFRRWFRKKMKIAGSEGTRYWITRLGRRQDLQYHEMVNENDALRQRITKAEEDIGRLKARPYTSALPL